MVWEFGKCELQSDSSVVQEEMFTWWLALSVQRGEVQPQHNLRVELLLVLGERISLIHLPSSTVPMLYINQNHHWHILYKPLNLTARQIKYLHINNMTLC